MPQRPFLRGLMGSQSTLPHPLAERHVPSLAVAIVVNFGAPHRLGDRESGGGGELDAWVVGLQGGPRRGEAVGEREFMVAALTPIGASLVLRLPMDLIAGEIAPLAEIDPRFARELSDRLGPACGWPGRFDAFESVIAARLADVEPPAIATRALRRLVATAGRASLSHLAAELDCSHRRLIGQFRDHIGATPKKVARLVRFGRALAAINDAGRLDRPDGRPYLDLGREGARPPGLVDWADLAVACGYYDQPHFIKEFHAFAGSSPGEFLQLLRPDAAG